MSDLVVKQSLTTDTPLLPATGTRCWALASQNGGLMPSYPPAQKFIPMLFETRELAREQARVSNHGLRRREYRVVPVWVAERPGA